MQLSSNHLDAWISILYVQAIVRKRVNRELEAAGLITLEVYDLLLTLEEGPKEGLDMTSLAEQMLLTQSGISRMVDRLSEKQLVEVKRSALNHRYKLVTLTGKGREERMDAWEIYRRILAEILGQSVSPEGAQAICKALSPILAGKRMIGFSDSSVLDA